LLEKLREKLKIKSPLSNIYEVDVLNKADLLHSMQDCDDVINALNNDKNNTLSRSMPLIIKAMTSYDLSRIITIGTAGILNSRNEQDLYRFQSSESKRKTTTAAKDHLATYEWLQKSNLNRTVVCPAYLPDDEIIS